MYVVHPEWISKIATKQSLFSLKVLCVRKFNVSSCPSAGPHTQPQNTQNCCLSAPVFLYFLELWIGEGSFHVLIMLQLPRLKCLIARPAVIAMLTSHELNRHIQPSQVLLTKPVQDSQFLHTGHAEHLCTAKKKETSLVTRRFITGPVTHSRKVPLCKLPEILQQIYEIWHSQYCLI